MSGRGKDKKVPLMTSFDVVFKTSPKSSHQIPIHFTGKVKIQNEILPLTWARKGSILRKYCQMSVQETLERIKPK